MGPVIMIIAVTAIISGTYIRAKKINLEKERLRLGVGGSPEFTKKRGLFSRGKDKISPLININQNKSGEIDKIQKRIENLEVIMLDQAESTPLPSQNESVILEELRSLSARLKKLEGK